MKIPISKERQTRHIEEQIFEITQGIKDLGRSKGERFLVKRLEGTKKSLEARLKKLTDDSRKDDVVTFEQLGVDRLFTDEADSFKNLYLYTKMRNVAGLSQTNVEKSSDLFMKCRNMDEQTDGKGIIFATGTPVSNSMSELYVMTNYLRPDLFKKSGIQNFDNWAADFGEVVTQLELKPAGDGFRAKKRFAKFANLPELMSMYKEFADIQTAEDLNLPVPKVNGGKPQVVVAKPTEFQKAYMKKLAERSEAVHGGHIDPRTDNMLKITHEARHLGLDQRTIDPTLENDPRSKINLCVDNIMSIYEKTAEQKGVQAVFCDIAVNEDDGKFSIYEALKDELIKRGIPENEICFAGDAKNIKQRNNMYSELRNGYKRIAIASTSKMGTGTNIQTRLCALHHLDIPWKRATLIAA